jgi:hypothetical protein
MEIKYRGETIIIIYEVSGSYVPGTWLDPPEYPDIHISQIEYNGVDILPILGDSDIDYIYELVAQKIHDES